MNSVTWPIGINEIGVLAVYHFSNFFGGKNTLNDHHLKITIFNFSL
jgi:hypothetical protein